LYWFWIIVSIFTSSLISYYSIPTYTLDNYDAVVDDILTIVLFIPSISILVSSIAGIITRLLKWIPLKMFLPVTLIVYSVCMHLKLIYYYSQTTTNFLIIFGLIIASFHFSLTKIFEKKRDNKATVFHS
jgi:hypothetical protein